MIRVLALVACLLTVCITASSAFIRHWQNGVGCEGWPACYRAAQRTTQAPIQAPPAAGPDGQGTLDAAVATIARVPAGEAPAPVRAARALHRVSATLAGVLVLLVVAFGWSTMGGGERIAAAVALVDTVFLSWLGRYTPHDLPLVTLGNLVGGLLLAAALAWIAAGRRGARRAAAPGAAGQGAAGQGAAGQGAAGQGAAGHGDLAGDGAPAVRSLALAALVLLALLAWGGTMIGARHAIDACSTPLCVSGAALDFAAMDPTQATVVVDAPAARGLHVAHRLLALALAFVVAVLAWRLRAERPAAAAWLALLVVAQFVLGAGTALGADPLLTTTLHNAVAALLVVALAAVAGSAAADVRIRRPAG
jgi:cytochrome c oxidase assembly protein subunit 15